MKLEAKVEIPEFRGDIDGEKLDAWLDRLESYFSLYGFNDLQKITFVRVKMESHALVWWNAYVQAHGLHGTTWDRFKELIRKQFYPVGIKMKGGAGGYTYVNSMSTRCKSIPQISRDGLCYLEYLWEIRRLFGSTWLALVKRCAAT